MRKSTAAPAALFLILLGSAAFPRAAIAQGSADPSLARIRDSLNTRALVEITEASGRRTKGRIEQLSDDRVVLLTEPSRRDPSGRRTLAPASIAKITESDGLGNGLLIGLAGGIAANYVFVRMTCGRPGYDHECAVNTGRVTLPILAPSGLILGALIDKALKRTLYRAGATR